MKMNKKKVVALALAVCLIATLSIGTLAWFTDSDEVDNKFLIAGSEDGDPNEVFSVDVWENTPDGDKDQDGHEYENILPGDSLKKEVHVENTGSYDQYIRVIVVVSDASQWREVLGTTEIPELSAIVGGLDTTKWNPNYKMYDAVNNTFWYSLYGKDILPATGNDVIQVFTTVNIPTSMTREQAATFTGGFDITVVAQAVQTQNVGGNAPAAFTTVGLNAQDAYDAIIAKWTNP